MVTWGTHGRASRRRPGPQAAHRLHRPPGSAQVTQAPRQRTGAQAAGTVRSRVLSLLAHFLLARSAAQPCLTLCDPGLQPPTALCPWESPGKSTGVGRHVLVQGIVPTRGWNPRLVYLLHWQGDSFPLVTRKRMSHRVSISDAVSRTLRQPHSEGAFSLHTVRRCFAMRCSHAHLKVKEL